MNSINDKLITQIIEFPKTTELLVTIISNTKSVRLNQKELKSLKEIIDSIVKEENE